MTDFYDAFHAGRSEMIRAFVRVSDLARRAGVDEEEISRLHGLFFDGNVSVKQAFWAAITR